MYKLILTLHVPGPPYGIVKADLVPPKQFQTFEVLPFGRDQFPAERQDKIINNSFTSDRRSYTTTTNTLT